MLKKTIAPLLAATALAFSVPALAQGSEDRARTAIAAAEAKIQTAADLGAAGALPDQTAEARAALATAKENFKRDRNDRSIEDAIRAQSLAEAVIGRLQNANQQAVADERAARNADVAAANQQALSAQQEAADANARAASAERSAAVSAAQAQAARDQAAATQAAAVETTVTTQQPTTRARKSTKTTVTRKTLRPATSTTGQVTTTTTVTQPGR